MKITNIFQRIKGYFKGPDIEAYKPGKIETNNFVFERYSEAFEDNKKRVEEMNRNRDAYDGDRGDLLGGDSTIYNDSRKEIFNSCLLSSEIHSVVSQTLAGSPRVYAKPVVDNAGFTAALMDPESAEILRPMLEMGRTPQEIVEAFWQAVVDNQVEEHRVHDLYYRLSVDARLEGIGQVTPLVFFDEDIGDYDVKSAIVRGPDIMYDKTSIYDQDLKYFFLTKYWRRSETCYRWPEFAKKIVITEEKDKQGEESPERPRSESNKYADRVKIVTGYFKDDTLEKVKNKEKRTNPETGIDEEIEIETIQRKYPHGRRFVFIPDLKLMLEDDKNPFPWLPITTYAPTPTSTSIYGKVLATALRPLQALHTQFYQQMIANIKLCGNPKGKATANAIIQPENINNKVGGFLEINGHLNSVELPRAVPVVGDITTGIREVELLAKKITGVFEPSQGKMPGSGTSGRAIIALQSGAETGLSPQKQFFRAFMQSEWKKNLEITMMLYKKGRRIRVKEEDDIPPVLPFDLSLVTADIDLEIADESHIPQTWEERLYAGQMLMNTKDWRGMGVVDGPWFQDFIKIPGKAKLRKRQMAEAQMMNTQQMQGTAGYNAPQINQPRLPEDNSSQALTPGEIATSPAQQLS